MIRFTFGYAAGMSAQQKTRDWIRVQFPQHIPGVVIALLLALVSSAHALPQDEFEIKTPFMSRLISVGAGILKTTKLEIKGEQILAHPSVEFILELEVNGEFVAVVPSDFDIKSIIGKEVGRTRMTEIQLNSKRDQFPITVFVRYFTCSDWPYMQKTILVKPIKKMQGATIRRVVIDDFMLKPEYAVFPGGFAAVNASSGAGIYYFTASLFGTERLTRFGGLTLAEETNHPAGAAYETGKSVIGAGWGGPDTIDQAFRDYLWDNYCIGRQRKQPLDDCVDVSYELTNSKQRVGALTQFADKCRDLRKQHPDKPLCLSLTKPVQSSYVHFLSVVDGVKVDLTSAASEESDKTRENLLRVFPPDTLKSISDAPPVVSGLPSPETTDQP